MLPERPGPLLRAGRFHTVLPGGPMYYQDLVLALENFFAKKGCVIQEPYDIEVGAGTMNPATFLRVLGPVSYTPLTLPTTPYV